MSRPICVIANEIEQAWRPSQYFAAKPYLLAMYSLDTIEDFYGLDSAKTIISYFLCNASTWKGETARKIKKELKEMINH